MVLAEPIMLNIVPAHISCSNTLTCVRCIVCTSSWQEQGSVGLVFSMDVTSAERGLNHKSGCHMHVACHTALVLAIAG